MLILIAGNPKSGKTISALSFPRPTLIFDFDDGAKSMYHTKDTNGDLVVQDMEHIRVIKLIKKEGSHPMNFKTTMKNASAPSYAHEAGDILGEYDRYISELTENNGTLDGIKYKTIIIDSLSSMFRLWEQTVLSMNNIPHLRIQDYGTMQSILFGAYLPPLKAMPVDYVILNAHVATEMTKEGSVIGQMPVAPSKNQGKALMQELDEIWQQKFEMGERLWYTKPEGYFEAGSRLDLPNPVLADFSSMKDALEEATRIEKELQEKEELA